MSEDAVGDIAIIGAGMAGLACAARLKEGGVSPVLFDKGRGPGGRMATRRAEIDGETVRFDHGAQYFTVRDSGFTAAVADWRDAGVVADWPAAGGDAVVGTPGMNAPIRHMAETQDVRWATRVEHIAREDGGWQLSIDGEAHRFARIVIAVPAEQAAELLAGHRDGWEARARDSASKPCWAVMAAFREKLPLGDVFKGDDVRWAARNSAKPGRDEGEHWVIHASPGWSARNLEMEREEAGQAILSAFFDEAAIAPQSPRHLAAHRWRYAMTDPAPGEASLWDGEEGIGVCGDWLSGPRVENAWISGDHLAKAILA